MPAGRPRAYDPQVADSILERLAGGESLNSICRDPETPARSTVLSWVLDDTDGFSAKYARARVIQAHSLVDDLNDIADDGTNDWMERNSPGSPGWVANGEHIQRSRLRYDARKWAASKILPKTYGDKLDVEVAGKNGGPIQSVTVTTNDPVEAARVYQKMMSGEAE